MSKISPLQILVAALFLLVTANITSCTTAKKVVYLNDLKDSVALQQIGSAQTDFENLIQKNDQLSITFGSSNPEDISIFNSGTVSGGVMAANTFNPSSGYLVEADGNIKFPLIGYIKAEGLSRVQLETKLTDILKNYTKNPVVNVRFLNYSYSVIGEVSKAGKYSMANERTTIFDALGSAGDMTVLGKRSNVLVIREVNGQRTAGRLNLLSKDVFNSPYFYIKTNDVIYVEPVNTKFFSRSGVSQYIGLAVVSLSLLITLINLRKIN